MGYAKRFKKYEHMKFQVKNDEHMKAHVLKKRGEKEER